jgi:hypothetical protein
MVYRLHCPPIGDQDKSMFSPHDVKLTSCSALISFTWPLIGDQGKHTTPLALSLILKIKELNLKA